MKKITIEEKIEKVCGEFIPYDTCLLDTETAEQVREEEIKRAKKALVSLWRSKESCVHCKGYAELITLHGHMEGAMLHYLIKELGIEKIETLMSEGNKCYQILEDIIKVGYVKKSELEIDKAKLIQYIPSPVGYESRNSVADNIVEASQDLIKEKKSEDLNKS